MELRHALSDLFPCRPRRFTIGRRQQPMNRLSPLAVALLLLSAADDPQVLPWRTNSAPQPDVLAGMKMPLFPSYAPPAQSQPSGAGQTANQPGDTGNGQAANAPKTKKDGSLEPNSELALVRFVDGEFAHAVRSIPGGKEGLILHPDKPFNDDALHRALATHGAAVNPGDPVQITSLRFKKTAIVVSINGGGKKKMNWLQHLQIGMEGLPVPTGTASNGDNGPDT